MAGRPKGTPKTGGRKKGTPNKNSMLLAETLKAFAFDPVKKLLDIFERLPDDLKVRVSLALIDNIYPKTKPAIADEASGDKPELSEQEKARLHQAAILKNKNDRK
jgi:hypothetical protein